MFLCIPYSPAADFNFVLTYLFSLKKHRDYGRQLQWIPFFNIKWKLEWYSYITSNSNNLPKTLNVLTNIVIFSVKKWVYLANFCNSNVYHTAPVIRHKGGNYLFCGFISYQNCQLIRFAFPSSISDYVP